MGETFRLLVTGSRDWNRPATVQEALLNIWTLCVADGQSLVVVHGCARGADSYAKSWALGMARHGHPVSEEGHPVTGADWERYGKAAGFRRNDAMVALGADLCLAFVMPCRLGGRCRTRSPHGSHGASQCAEKATAAGIPVRRADG